jgi:hypothetical protein
MPKMVRGIAIFLTFAAAPSAVAEGMRYELFSQPDVGAAHPTEQLTRMWST